MNPIKRRKYIYQLQSLFVRKYQYAPSSLPIDVIIPLVEKDLAVLPLCLQGVRACVTNTVARIYVVASKRSEAIRSFCMENNLNFVAEEEVLGFGPREIDYKVNGINRSGWLFQQLLKLAGNIGSCEHYLVIDADHILIQPHTFLTSDNRVVFYQSREYHKPYYDTMQQLCGEVRMGALSYVAHKMLFSKEELEHLKKRIETHTGQPWIQAILNTANPEEMSCFSEYETYGCCFPAERKILRPWRNKSLKKGGVMDYASLQRRYSNYRALTFPDYKSNPPQAEK